ncbi:hypothetical protein Tco_0931816 [Tanacetum coccineum]
MEVDVEEEDNESELIFPYVEADPLNPPPPAFDSESEDVVEVEDMVEPEDSDSLLPSFMRRDINSLFGQIASLIRRVCGRETAHALVEMKGKAKDKYYGKLIADLGNEVRCSVGERDTVLEDIIKDFGNAKERVECKKLKKDLEDARSSNTLLSMQKEQVERDLYWTRVQTHEFYQEMIRRGFMLEERANEAIDVPVKDEESPSSKLRGSPRDSYFMKCNLSVFHGTEWAVELQRWFEKTKMVFGISECAEGKKFKFAAATLQGADLTWWNTKIATMGWEGVN